MMISTKTFFKFLICALFLNTFNAFSQIDTYAWPETSDLGSDSKYEVKARTYDASSQTYGEWKYLTEFLSVPRNYTTHWKTEGDGLRAEMRDRTLTFVMFAFSGTIELEVTQKISTSNAQRVEIAPKAFGIVPHFFDGKTVRFRMDKPEYISVNFDFGSSDRTINGDGDRKNGKNIKNGMVILADNPETQAGYTIPNPTDPGVVVWSNSTPLSTIRNANIIYFPPGETNLKDHPDRWERNGSDLKADADANWVRNSTEYDNAPLYRGRLFLAKDGQKVYLAPGAIVYGGIHANGRSNNAIFGRGIMTARKHLLHEIFRPLPGVTVAYDAPYTNQTNTNKRAYCEFGNGANFNGVLFLEAWHHTCPSGQNSTIKDIKIIGWCYNNDGIRPSANSVVDRVFIKTNDDYDYARDKHTVSNGVFWPGNNCGVGMLGWGDLGSGYAEYRNCNIINAEWDEYTIAAKGNVGLISGGQSDEGIKLQNNIYQNIQFENPTNFLAAVLIEPAGAAPAGFLKNFLIKNVSTEFPFQTPDGTKCLQEMQGLNNTWVEGWTYTNLIVDGNLVTWDNHKDYFALNLVGTNGVNSDDAKRCRNITFNSEGVVYNITYNTTGNGTLRPVGKNNSIQAIGGQSPMISFNPATGNRIQSITIDNQLIYEYGNPSYTMREPAIVFQNINTNHTVDVVFASGADTYDLPINFATLSVKKNDNDQEPFIVYPNPAKSKIYADCKNGYKILSISGQILLQSSLPTSEIDISSLSDGIYLLKTETQLSKFTKK
ncbi:T9SS type A sorting domain-containing protein [Flavobacterium nackdongense]|uniref:T9SS type A sorting domain-containing protein n=1 Tax=Flavobacterium nackdongense TaxID=2547394 RepID=A0A4P6YBF2_9FLAO|nr:T9SS type A sorting domain-containing protein [Flavobacterium nackdongense]QBN20501.1 T9SS type A sorting domain-containing protein [Flavobacterium nackdongense]